MKLILKALTSLLIPGAIYIYLGKRFLAFFIPVFALLWVFLLSYTRSVINIEGFIALLLGVFSIHILTLTLGLIKLIQLHNKEHLIYWKTSLFFLFLFNSAIVVSSHLYKSYFYGFELYHIPSQSMQATIQAGDVVLVDTWLYKSALVKTNDIIVFKKKPNGLTLVKRVSKVIHSRNNAQYYVLGDNQAYSIDSNDFGWLKSPIVIGKVSFLFFSFKDQRFLQGIK